MQFLPSSVLNFWYNIHYYFLDCFSLIKAKYFLDAIIGVNCSLYLIKLLQIYNDWNIFFVKIVCKYVCIIKKKRKLHTTLANKLNQFLKKILKFNNDFFSKKKYCYFSYL